jgi:parallel beta-helix repeat protein
LNCEPSIVKGNTITSSDIGVYASDTNGVSNLTIASNTLASPAYYGVVLRDSNLTLSGNTFNGGLYGVAVVADSQNTGATLSRNSFSGQKTGSLFTWALSRYQVTVDLK